MDAVTTISRAVEDDLVQALDLAFQHAVTCPKPEDAYLSIPGMSGWRYRVLINKLISQMSGASYLEIGSWKGSTLCSAIDSNTVRALAIDNWSQFGGPKDEFLANVSRFKPLSASVSYIESDFRNVDFADIGTFKVYLFDGPHEQMDQHDGVIIALPALADRFILIVDDWNYPPVPTGTKSAIAAAGLKLLQSIEIRTTLDGSHPEVAGEHSEWHNGYFIGVMEKPGIS